ncbi:MAG: pantetheine-phosphate adenylyltransferase [bacterium]
MKGAAIYAGSFDPVTNGHLDLVERALKVFDRLIVAVVANPAKDPLFTLEERVDMLSQVTQDMKAVTVESFSGLLVDFVKKCPGAVVVRGLRAVSDFEFEFQLGLTNRVLDEDIETIFMLPSLEYIYLRASLVKEVAQLGGDVSGFVPPLVKQRLAERCRERRHAIANY